MSAEPLHCLASSDAPTPALRTREAQLIVREAELKRREAEVEAKLAAAMAAQQPKPEKWTQQAEPGPELGGGYGIFLHRHGQGRPWRCPGPEVCVAPALLLRLPSLLLAKVKGQS